MNKRKIWKRVIAFTIVLGMIASMFTGCVKKSEAENKPQAKGRYVEREIKLPEGLGNPLGMIYKDHKLVVYTYSADEKYYQSYVYENEKWSAPQKESWMMDARERLNQNIMEVFSGKDGNVYGRTESIKGSSLLKAEDGLAKEITLQANSENETSGSMDAAVLKDGTIGIGNYANAMVEFYDEGKLVFATEGIEAGSEEHSFFRER